MCAVRSGGKGGGASERAKWRGNIMNELKWVEHSLYGKKRKDVGRGMGGMWVRIPSVRRGIVYHVLREEAKREFRHPTSSVDDGVG